MRKIKIACRLRALESSVVYTFSTMRVIPMKVSSLGGYIHLPKVISAITGISSKRSNPIVFASMSIRRKIISHAVVVLHLTQHFYFAGVAQ